MRCAGTLHERLLVRRFADYMVTRGLAVRIDHDGDAFTVWVLDDEHLEQVRNELTRFVAASDDPRYDVGREAERLRADARAAAGPPPPAPLAPVSPALQAGPMATPLTLATMALCVIIAIWTQFGAPEAPQLSKLTIATVTRLDVSRIQWAGLQDIADGEIWRLLTPCFLHFGVVHLLFNMMWLYDLGRQIEVVHGTLALALMITTIGVASNYGQYVATGPYFGGMSGVVYGLFGYALVMSRFAPRRGLVVSASGALVMGIWFAVCLTGLVGPIANVAHGVGLVLGLGFGGIAVWWHARRQP